jgi:hypothetical protein
MVTGWCYMDAKRGVVRPLVPVKNLGSSMATPAVRELEYCCSKAAQYGLGGEGGRPFDFMPIRQSGVVSVPAYRRQFQVMRSRRPTFNRRAIEIQQCFPVLKTYGKCTRSPRRPSSVGIHCNSAASSQSVRRTRASSPCESAYSGTRKRRA